MTTTKESMIPGIIYHDTYSASVDQIAGVLTAMHSLLLQSTNAILVEFIVQCINKECINLYGTSQNLAKEMFGKHVE